MPLLRFLNMVKASLQGGVMMDPREKYYRDNYGPHWRIVRFFEWIGEIGEPIEPLVKLVLWLICTAVVLAIVAKVAGYL